MKKYLTITFITISCFIISGFKPMIQNSPVTDYISVPGPLTFEGEKYILKWSSHAQENHYKQEYVRANDKLEAFNKMIFIEILLTDANAIDLVNAKIKEIESRKGKDHVANYQVLDNKKTGEFLLDFLISEGDGDIIEWNAYRYKNIITPKGKGVMLFSYSFRSFEGAELSL
ncbi:MAG: hypothetical protein ACK40G_18555, partial [Cytophagaceae bacterium]